MRQHKHAQPQKIAFYLQVHQPRRLRMFQYLDSTHQQEYFDDDINEMLVKRVAQDCYIPMNDLLRRAIVSHPGIRINMSVPGETLDLLERYCPDALESFTQLFDTGAVELLAETYYHSIASMISVDEFHAQVSLQMEKIYHHFRQRPVVVRNTELIYNDHIGEMAAAMGFRGIVADNSAIGDGAGSVFTHPQCDVNVLMRDRGLSEEVSHRFGAGDARLSIERYIEMIGTRCDSGDPTIIGFDYENFGDRLKQDAGMPEFFVDLLATLSSDKKYSLSALSDLINNQAQPVNVSGYSSWRDDASASFFIGNDMQLEAVEEIRAQADSVYDIADAAVIDNWRSLQNSEHFLYMATLRTGFNYNDPYSPYPSPYEAFITFINTLKEFSFQLKGAPLREQDDQHARAIEYDRQHPKVPTWAMSHESQQRIAQELKL